MAGATDEPTILVVEDDEASRRLLETILSRLDRARVISAPDGGSALDLAESESPDLVVLDLHLPDFDGDELLRRLRATERLAEVPAVVVTADATARGRRRAVDAGATLVLTKPVDVDEVLVAVTRLLPQTPLLVPDSDVSRPEAASTLQAIFRASPLAIVAVGKDGLVRLWNPAAERMFGWTAEEMTGRPLPIVPAGDAEAFEQTFARVLAGESVRLETTRQRKDGVLLDVSVALAPWLGAGEAVVGAIGLVEDITERKRTERDLVDRNRELTALHETALTLVQRRGVRDALEAIVSEAAELLDAPYGYVCLASPDRETLTVEVAIGNATPSIGMQIRRGEGMAGAVLESEQPLVIGDYQGWPGRTSAFSALGIQSAAVVPLRTSEGVAGVLGVAWDYPHEHVPTELELVERFGRLASLALENARLNDEVDAHATELAELLDRERTARALLSAVVDASPLAIVAADLDNRVTMWNRAAERTFGWSADEVLGSLPPHVPEEELENPEGPRELALRGEPVQLLEAVRTRSDGTALDANVFLSPIRDPGGEITGFMAITEDVTERRRAERDLRNYAEQLSLALDAAAMGTWERDADLLGPTWSPELRRLYGVDEFSGRHEDFLELVHPCDRERVDETIKTAIASGDALGMEFRVLRPDGEPRWFLTRGRKVVDQQGAVRWVGITADVTEQKRAELERREVEERYRILVEQIPAITYLETADSTGRTLYVSPQIETLLGISQEEWMANPLAVWIELVHPDDRELAAQAYREALESGVGFDMEYRAVGRDGTLRWFRDLARIVRVEPGESPLLHGVMLDITEQKESEEKTLRAGNLLESIFRASPVAIVASGRDGRKTMWNAAAEEIFGWSADEMIGREVALVPEGGRDEADALRARVLAGESFRGLEARRLRKDGTEIAVSLSAAPQRDETGEVVGLIAVAQDISDRERARRELEENVELLRRTDEQRRWLLGRLVRAQEEERQRIATDIHDDSVQVLTALALRLELLRDRVPRDVLGEPLDDAVDTARRAIGRLRHLIFELHPPALDRDGLGPATRALLQEIQEDQGLRTVLHDRLDSEPEPAARAILFRIVQEAVTNVAKHARARTVTVVLQDVGGGHQAIVTDDGIGFDVEEHRGRNGHIGLTSMRERAEMAGGRLAIRSTPGRGTRVEAEIPAGVAA